MDARTARMPVVSFAMTVRRRRAIPISIFAAFLLTGCGGGGSDPAVPSGTSGEQGGPVADNVGDSGAVGGSEDAEGTDDRLRGDVFFEIVADPASDPFDNFVFGQAEFFGPSGSPSNLGTDEDSTRVGDCRILRRDTPEERPGESASSENPAVVPVRYLSAGEALTLSTPEGTFGELRRSGGAGEYRYGYGVEDSVAEEALPRELVLDIPGEEFPMASALTVPYLEPMLLLAPSSGTTVSADVTVEWAESDTGRDRVFVTLSSFSDDFRRGLSVSCVSPDDGAYALPPEVVLALEPLPAGLPFPGQVIVSRGVSVEHESDRFVVEISIVSSSSRDLDP